MQPLCGAIPKSWTLPNMRESNMFANWVRLDRRRHLPNIIWAVVAYDLWRNHRETRKLRKPEVVIGGF